MTHRSPTARARTALRILGWSVAVAALSVSALMIVALYLMATAHSVVLPR